MKIALLSWESLHSIPVGGLSVHVTELAAALERMGNEVHIFTRIGPNQRIYEVIEGVHYHRCPFAFHSNIIREMNNMCSSFLYYLKEAEKFGGFEIVHGHDWHVVNALDELKKMGKKIVFTLHSTQFGRDGNHFHDGIAQDIRNIEWYGTYIAERVIVCSNAMKEEIKWVYKVPEDKIRVIPNGIWAERFDGYVDPWRDVKRHYGIGVYDPLIVYVGRMTKQKGPDLLLEAVPQVLQQFPNAKFIFVGDGYLRPELEKRAKEMGLEGKVIFTGYISDEEKMRIMKAGECVVVPSRNEPFGIVVLEAWSCEKPVISTHGTGAGELIWHGFNGLKVYQEPESIAWGIKEILRDVERSKWMGKNGRDAAEKLFTWDRVARETLKVYEEIL